MVFIACFFFQEKRALERKLSEYEEELKVRAMQQRMCGLCPSLCVNYPFVFNMTPFPISICKFIEVFGLSPLFSNNLSLNSPVGANFSLLNQFHRSSLPLTTVLNNLNKIIKFNCHINDCLPFIQLMNDNYMMYCIGQAFTSTGLVD